VVLFDSAGNTFGNFIDYLIIILKHETWSIKYWNL